MTLNVLVTTSLLAKKNYISLDEEKYIKADVAHKFAADLARNLLDDESCLIKDDNDDYGYRIRHYQIQVLTPDQYKELVMDIQRRLIMGMPVVG